LQRGVRPGDEPVRTDLGQPAQSGCFGAELRGGFVRLTSVSAAVGRIIDLTGMREAVGCGTEQHGSFGPNFKPNGPDATRRRKCDAAQVFRISAEGPRRKPYEWGM